MIVKTTKIGVKGNNDNVRLVYSQTSSKYSEELFVSLTKDAISKTTINTPKGLLIKADMGNENYIVLRYFSTTSPNAFSVLEYNFKNLLGTNSFEIKFLP